MNTQRTNKIAESSPKLFLLFLAMLISIAFSIPDLDFDISTMIFVTIIFLSFIVIKYFKIGLAIYFSFLIGCIISTIGAEGFGVAVGGLFALIMVFPYSIILGISQFLFVRKKNKSLSKWNIVGFAFVYFMGCFVTMAATDAIDHLF